MITLGPTISDYINRMVALIVGFYLLILSTVKLGYNELGYNELGYNELGYNEHPDITNKLNSFGWFELF